MLRFETDRAQRYRSGTSARPGPFKQAVVLCGGLGTRLQSTVPDVPKALAPVAGRPFLDYLLAGVAAAGICEVILCAGHKAEMLRSNYGESAGGVSIRYSVEPRPLGTAGALGHAAPYLSDAAFLLLNGDSLVEVDYERLAFAHASTGAKATMTLARVEQPGRYGTAVRKGNGEIAAFLEKGEACAAQDGHRFINAGVYAMDPCVLKLIPAKSGAISLEREVLPRLVGDGLFGLVSGGFFIDIGVPEDYARAQTELPRRFNCAGSHSC